jgi:hypothetical protein
MPRITRAIFHGISRKGRHLFVVHTIKHNRSSGHQTLGWGNSLSKITHEITHIVAVSLEQSMGSHGFPDTAWTAA